MGTRPHAPEPDPGQRSTVFDGWYETHGPSLRAYATRLTGCPVTADDVVQEAFARAWTSVDRLASEGNPPAWLYRVTRNLCMDVHRRRRRFVETDTDISETAASTDADPQHELERREVEQEVRDALSTLRDRHRESLVLRYVLGVPSRDLAGRLGLSTESTRAILARARKRLRDELRVAGWAAEEAEAAD